MAARDTTTLDEGYVVGLRGKFTIKDLGDANFYVVCHIKRSWEEVAIKFDQHLYVETVAERYEVTQTSVITPAPGAGCLCRRRTPQATEMIEMQGVRYRSSGGTLMGNLR